MCLGERRAEQSQERAGKATKTSGRQSKIGATLVHVDDAQNRNPYCHAIEQPASWLFRHDGVSPARCQPRAAAGHRAPALYAGVIGGSILIGGYYDFN